MISNKLYMTPMESQCKFMKNLLSNMNCNNSKTLYKSMCNKTKNLYNANCVDPCKGVTCGINEVCQKGVCVPTCYSSGHICTLSADCCSNDCNFGSCT